MTDSSRREFLAEAASEAASLVLASGAAPLSALFPDLPASPIPDGGHEPFATLEKIADGVWAVISNPFGGDRTTLANGGIVAGRDGVLAVEAFYTPQGAAWLSEKARDLTGRRPTHVLLTHYHADHANGLAGYVEEGRLPTVRSTARTRDLVLERNTPADPARSAALQQVELLSAAEPTTLDLGGRVVRMVPRAGHTESDVVLEIDDPSIVFCGDLFWNGLFPNYVDAIPTQLSLSSRALRRSADTVYVSGHGPRGRLAEVDRYIAVIDEVERAARQAHAAGRTAAEAATTFALPSSLALTRPAPQAGVQVALEAWERELAR